MIFGIYGLTCNCRNNIHPCTGAKKADDTLSGWNGMGMNGRFWLSEKNDSNNQVKPSMILFVNYLVRHSLPEYIIEKSEGKSLLSKLKIVG